jgi:hypothetical protein
MKAIVYHQYGTPDVLDLTPNFAFAKFALRAD